VGFGCAVRLSSGVLQRSIGIDNGPHRGNGANSKSLAHDLTYELAIQRIFPVHATFEP